MERLERLKPRILDVGLSAPGPIRLKDAPRDLERPIMVLATHVKAEDHEACVS
jgi:hypothetical protein